MNSNDRTNTQAQVDLAVTTGTAIAAQKDLDRIASENALRAELKDREHAHAPSRAGALRDEVEQLQLELAAVRKENAHLRTRVSEADAVLLEWMHANEAFKRLARRFGAEANLSVDEVADQVDQELARVADEDTKFQRTKMGLKARDRIAAKPR